MGQQASPLSVRQIKPSPTIITLRGHHLNRHRKPSGFSFKRSEDRGHSFSFCSGHMHDLHFKSQDNYRFVFQAWRLTRFSFKASVAPENGASKFELVATNDAMCHQYSNWDIISQDLSGKGFASDEVSSMECLGISQWETRPDTRQNKSRALREKQ